MTSFRKLWLPAILLVFFLPGLVPFSEQTKEIQKTDTVAEKIIRPVKNIIAELVEITNDDILRFAKNASKETGVRREYLFAIYSQETSSGKNLGSCFLFDPDVFGPGVGVNLRSGIFSKRIMKPERDIKPFFATMEELGRNPYLTPVSCPMKDIGWGGGMGHMQFIASTWILVKDRTAIALGKAVADPWNIEDAIMAAAIHLQDLGADRNTVSHERTAACRYFSGKPCGETKVILIKKKHKKPRYKKVYVENRIIAQYGNSIIKKTAYYHKLLNPHEVAVAKADTKTKKWSAKEKQLAKNFPKKQEIADDTPKQKKKRA